MYYRSGTVEIALFIHLTIQYWYIVYLHRMFLSFCHLYAEECACAKVCRIYKLDIMGEGSVTRDQ